MREWEGQTVAILASGPSMCQEDADYVRGKARVIVVNTTFRLALWSDKLYTNDHDWLAAHKAELDATFQGQIVCGHSAWSGVDEVYHWPFDKNAKGLWAKPGHIAWGMNSGAAALSLAHQLGASKIILLGYDQQWRGDQPRWHGWHPEGLQNQKPGFHRWAKWFHAAAKDFRLLGIPVINCSRETSLTCFSRRPLREAL